MVFVSEALMRLSSKPYLISAVGRDPYGKEILKRLNGLVLQLKFCTFFNVEFTVVKVLNDIELKTIHIFI